MKQIDIALKHIRLLYAVLLVVLVVNICYNVQTYNFDDAIVSFKEGYAEGRQDSEARRIHPTKREKSFKLYEVMYNPLIKSDNKQVIYGKDSSRIEIETSAFDVKLTTLSKESQPMWLKIANWFLQSIGFIAVIWAIILTIRLIINLGWSIFKKDIFNRRTIRLCRWYAMMMAISSAAFGMHIYITDITVAPYLDGTQWELIPSFPLDLSTLTIALLIYIFSEILNIGRILKQEQELTI